MTKRGFTLIELLVVLAIILIMTGIALVSMSPALRDARLRSACRTTASVLNYARSRAVATNTTLRVVFNQDQSLEVDSNTGDPKTGDQWTALTTPAGKHRYLPERLMVARIVKGNGVENENWVEFTKLGQGERAVIQFTDDSGLSRYVIVDPITGRCRIENYLDDTMFAVQTTK